MSSSTTPLGQAIRLALVAGTAGLASTAVLAQDATPTTLDRIEITGSRIRQVDVESAQPVLAISRADIERQGFSSVADILQNLTAVGSPALSRSNVLAAGENAGGTYIDMRNLGAQRTLVLINGKRLGINTGGYQDISSVPVSAIERMEVLKDGASAIYGSDAMAGVINIITRSNVSGVTANVYQGQYSEGDGARTSVDVVAGWSNDRASLTFSAEHTEEKGVWARNRWFSEFPNTTRHPGDNWTQLSQWGQITGLRGPGCTAAAGCNYSLDRGADPTNPANYHLSDLTPFTGDVSNAQEQMHLISPLKRDSLFLDGRLDLTDDIRLTTQLGYNKRTSTRQVAGYPLQSATAGIGRMSADSWFNPFGNHHGYDTPTDIAWNRRAWEVPRVSTSELTTWRAVAALEGSFEVGERYFDWEVGYQYNRSELLQRSTGNLHKERVKNAVGPSYYNEATGKVECGVPGAPIAGCMPWNPLAPYGSNDPNGLSGNQALIDHLFPPEITRGKTTTRNAFASIAGTVMTLPAGDLGFAFGVETRKEAGEFIPDALAQSGATTNLAAGPTGGGYKVNEAYLELSVPIFAKSALGEKLDLSLAGRYSDYSTFGGEFTPKYGLRWQVTNDFVLRTSYAEGFRAPSIGELYGSAARADLQLFDPCSVGLGGTPPRGSAANCAALGVPDGFQQANSQISVTTGGNAELDPERSRSFSAGFVWSPWFGSNASWSERFDVEVTFYRHHIEGAIQAINAQTQLDLCVDTLDPLYCDGITRAGTGAVSGFNNRLTNLGSIKTDGWDVDLFWTLPQTEIGQFKLGWQNTFVGRYEALGAAGQKQPQGPGVEVADSSIPEWTSNATLSWNLSNWNASWTVRHISKLTEECGDVAAFPICGNQAEGTNELAATTFHDMQVGYRFDWMKGLQLSAGLNNVFDKDPPICLSCSLNGYDASTYDIPRGRYWYLRSDLRF